MDTKEKQTVSGRLCLKCGHLFFDGEEVCPNDGLPLAASADAERIGTILADHYQLTSLIGAGGTSAVYIANHNLMERVVAVKMLHSHLVSHQASYKRFVQEAEAVSQLHHQHIIALHDFGITPQGQPYLIMDYLQGQSLSEALEKEQRLHYKRAIHILLQVCDAVAYAHSRKILHRDLKPSNVMLIEHGGEKDYVMIVDFGIAKMLPGADGEAQRLTQTGEVCGSPVYMSPEQCMGQPLDAQSDIYSLGCMIYEMLAGDPPFIGSNTMETMYKRITDAAPPFAAALEIPAPLEAIVFTALAREREERYRSMLDLKRDLELFAGSAEDTMRLQELKSRARARKLSLQLRRLTARPVLLSLACLLVAIVIPAAMLQFAVQPQPITSLSSLTWQHCSEEGQKQVDQGNLPQAETWFRKAVHEAERFGEQDERLTASIEKLAYVLENEGKVAEATSLFARLDQIRRHGAAGEGSNAQLDELAEMTLSLVPKKISPDTWGQTHQVVEKLQELALLCIRKRNYARAEQLLKTSLDIEVRSLGAEHPNIARTLTHLAVLYSTRSTKPDKAKPLFERAVVIRAKALGESHPDVALSLSDLASVHKEQGNYEYAEQLYKKALSIYANTRGDTSPDASEVLTGLAEIYRIKSDYARAEPLYQKALDIRRGIGGDELAIGSSLNNLAGLYFTQGKYNLALPLYEEALRIFERTKGLDDPSVATILNNLGVLHFKQENYAKAVPALNRALSIRERSLPPAHPQVAQSLNTLAEVLRSLGRYKQADDLYRQALDINRHVFGNEHAEVAMVLNGLGQLKQQSGELQTAERYLDEALKIREKVLGVENVDTSNSIFQLAELHLKQGRFSIAEREYLKALAVRSKLLGERHPDVAAVQNGYAALLLRTGRIFHAIRYKLAALGLASVQR